MIESRSASAGSRRAAEPTSSTSGTARLRGTSRIVDDEPQRTGAAARRGAGPVPTRRGRCPFGTTDTSAPNTSRTREAASLLTALRAARARCHRVCPTTVRSGSDDAVEHAVPGDRGRQAQVERDPGPVERERREHPGVHVDDVRRRAPEGVADEARADRVDGQVEREPRAEPVDVDAVLDVDHPAALTRLAEGGGQHVDLVPGGDLPRGEVTHLRLDAAGARRVAVADVGDQHVRPGRCGRPRCGRRLRVDLALEDERHDGHDARGGHRRQPADPPAHLRPEVEDA